MSIEFWKIEFYNYFDRGDNCTVRGNASRQEEIRIMTISHLEKFPSLIILPLVLMLYPRQTAAQGARFTEIVRAQILRYPKIEIQDLYKLVYQASFGSAHFGLDSAMARDWLMKEWNDSADGPVEPVVDTISDGRDVLVRVNIRSYKSHGGDMEKLLHAFVFTAKNFHGSSKTFDQYWNYLEKMAEKKDFPFSSNAQIR